MKGWGKEVTSETTAMGSARNEEGTGGMGGHALGLDTRTVGRHVSSFWLGQLSRLSRKKAMDARGALDSLSLSLEAASKWQFLAGTCYTRPSVLQSGPGRPVTLKTTHKNMVVEATVWGRWLRDHMSEKRAKVIALRSTSM